MRPIWEIRELKPIHHRIIWWVVDARAVGKILQRGWQQQCSLDLGVHRVTIRTAIKKMIGWGIIIPGEKRGEVMLIPGIFDRKVDLSKLKVKEK